MANVTLRFHIADLSETAGTRRITAEDGGTFVLGQRTRVPDEVTSILADGDVASVMVSVNFCNDVVRMYDIIRTNRRGARS